jgi:hypothetical protein
VNPSDVAAAVLRETASDGPSERDDFYRPERKRSDFGDLPVGDAWPLIFTRGEGFKLDPKEERTAEELEERIRTDRSSEWRTVREWAGELGIREGRARKLLEQLAESGLVATEVGPVGRSARAHCYRTAPNVRAQSGVVTQLGAEVATTPLRPTSIGDVGAGSSTSTAPDSGAVGRPLLADDGYLDRLFKAFQDGHVTEGEWRQAERAHRFVVGAAA